MGKSKFPIEIIMPRLRDLYGLVSMIFSLMNEKLAVVRLAINRTVVVKNIKK